MHNKNYGIQEFVLCLQILPEFYVADVPTVTALHDYQGESSNDLSFNAGDNIKVVKRINSDWLMGELNGKEGLFPASFVESESDSLSEPSISNNKEVEQPEVFIQ